MAGTMERGRKTTGTSDGDVCDLWDTSIGDTDDVCSVCSWTTDQGDCSDVERYSAQQSNVTQQNLHCAPWGVSSEGVMNSAQVAGYQCAADGSMSYCLDSSNGEIVPMCLGYNGYMPSVVPVCYVVMPTMENALPWPEATSTMQPVQGNAYKVPSTYCARGQWAKPARKQAAKSASTTQQSKALKDKSSALDSSDSRLTFDSSEATTVILRNLPKECNRDMLLEILDEEGFSGAYDFLHLPIDFQSKAALGYALLNLVSHDMALRVQEHFNGFPRWPRPSNSPCEVAWNSPHQGLATHIDRYRNSPLMHSSVPETYRPTLFENGVRVQFPPPTTKIRAPRIRHPKPSNAIRA